MSRIQRSSPIAGNRSIITEVRKAFHYVLRRTVIVSVRRRD